MLFAVLSKGVVAVLGPQSKANSDHIKSICDNTEVPYIETRPALTERHQLSSINLHPDPDKMGDILGELGWDPGRELSHTYYCSEADPAIQVEPGRSALR